MDADAAGHEVGPTFHPGLVGRAVDPDVLAHGRIVIRVEIVRAVVEAEQVARGCRRRCRSRRLS